MSIGLPLSIAIPATTTSAGIITLANALGGTPDLPLVLGIGNPNVLVSGTPAAGQVLTASSGAAATWTTPAGTSSTAKRVVLGTDGATVTPNSATTDIFRVIIAGNRTFAVPSGTPVDGQQMVLEITQDGTGGRTGTFATGYGFSTDIPAPTLSTAAGATDIIGIQYNAASSKWRVLGIVKGF